MPSKFLNISTDTTLGGNAPSDELAVSQKAIKTYVDTHGGGGGSVSIDDLTITRNSDQEIQTVAVIDQNTGIIKPWSGTGAEYEDISEIDPDTLYITDDLGLPATEIGQITEALNDKVDKGHQVIEFQAPTAANNYTWYRKYADGWVEQGGIATGTNGTITLSVEMAGSNYQIMANVKNTSITGSNAAVFSLLTNDLTTTSFGFKKTYNYGSASGVAGEDYFWQVSGMAA